LNQPVIFGALYRSYSGKKTPIYLTSCFGYISEEMSLNKFNYQSALQDFNEARLKASLEEALARLTGKSNELLSYDEVAKKLKLYARADRGIQEIPLNAIVGSVGRYTDFTRTFLPRKPEDQDRWARVKAAIVDPAGMGLEPIEVYKVGEVYFVLDGNHRVSIARQEGSQFIEAHVIEVKTDIPITPDLQPDDLIIKAEYANFLEKTEIKTLFPNTDLSVTVPGQYEKLLEHIEVHRYFMGLDSQRTVPYQEAVKHWYETVYTPFVEPIRERGILRWFPGRTETDLYLWVSEHLETLKNELGWPLGPGDAAIDLAKRANPRVLNDEAMPGHWRQSKLYDRYTDHLFKEVLVPVGDSEEGFLALEQAILVAQKESVSLHGLHVLTPNSKRNNSKAKAIQSRFNQRCQEAGVTGSLAIVQGEIADQINAYSLLTDLIVMNVSRPPEPGLSSLGSGLRSIIWRSARPILTVPGRTSPMDRALLAFDGSAKSKEALFVATYVAELWKTSLTVMTLSDSDTVSSSVQDYARKYLDVHEIEADYVLLKGSLDTFLKVSKERDINLILMGGYSGTALKEILIGSLVNHLLRGFGNSILICR
jgi:nucleotide-binding universal stress UspA family protein